MSLRGGGHSAAPFDQLNLGAQVGDDPLRVAANRRALRDALQLPAEPLWLQQVHGTEVRCADRPGSLRADAAWSAGAGVVCAVQVADCLPVLLASEDGAVVGAAHAGWRGLCAGVLEAAVAALGVPGSRLDAWLGPAISQPHFEVGDEVRAAFIARDPASALAFERNAHGRWQCSLALLARQRLQAVGVQRITDSGLCTFADPQRFYSHRRAAPTGRMAALIWREA